MKINPAKGQQTKFWRNFQGRDLDFFRKVPGFIEVRWVVCGKRVLTGIRGRQPLLSEGHGLRDRGVVLVDLVQRRREEVSRPGADAAGPVQLQPLLAQFSEQVAVYLRKHTTR